jgi:glucose-6-phosphate 1-epimerase
MDWGVTQARNETMNTAQILSELQDQYASLSEVSFFKGKGGLPFIRVNNRFCDAEISLLGGQVLSFRRKDQMQPVLFCSEAAYFEQGKGIKGGVPVCWPWFGDHPQGLGAHGFARSNLWNVDRIERDDCEVVELVLSLPAQAFGDYPEWQDVRLSTKIRLGKWLTIALITENHLDKAILLSQALHTYFQVLDCRNISIEGLENNAYLDKPSNFQRQPPTGDAITIDSEVDRIYEDVQSPITLLDPSWNRSITLTSEGSASAVVWNPWVEKSKAMSDFGDDEYMQMVCIETTNAASDARVLEPGQSHTMQVKIHPKAID